MAETFVHFGGKLHLYKREGTPHWQCSTYLDGRNHRTTTRETDPHQARKRAEEWYLSLQLKHRAGELKGDRLFKNAAAKFLPEYEALTAGERSPRHVERQSQNLRVHLLPYFGNMPVKDIKPQTVQDYRVHRLTSRKDKKTGEPKRPSRSTIHNEIITLRHVLKTAQRIGWLEFIPDLSAPYKASGKITHRAWFSPAEYKQLYTATRERAENPPHGRWRWECEQLHDYVLFRVNTGLRPDEAARLEFRDVEIVRDKATKETILEISVRGKRGVGYCKSMPGAVVPFERLKARKRWDKPAAHLPKGGNSASDKRTLVLPTLMDKLFPGEKHTHLNNVLNEQKLKLDREGLRRSAYSLRHTYICLRLMEGADIYQIAKNCRTSVEMIEKFYAAHIKNMIDASAVNVRRDRSDDRPKKRGANVKRPTAGNGKGRPKPRR